MLWLSLALSFGKAVHQPCRGVDFGMNLLRGGGEQTVTRILAIIDNRASVEACQAASRFMEDQIGRRNIPIMRIFRGEAGIERTRGDCGNTQCK